MRNSFNRHNFIIMLVVLTAVGISGCRKGYDFRNATIVGQSIATCACCGGLLMEIEGEKPPGNLQYFQLKNQPAEFGIDNNTVFPVYGKVVWVTDESRCDGAIIDIIAWIKR